MKYWEIIADNLSKAGWSWAVRLQSSICRTKRRREVLEGRVEALIKDIYAVLLEMR